MLVNAGESLYVVQQCLGHADGRVTQRYVIAQELQNNLVDGHIATLITRTIVDPADVAFSHPSKPIGPTYTQEAAEELAAERGWSIAADGDAYRRVVASPAPQSIIELNTIRLLMEAGTVVICCGGGGIPVLMGKDKRVSGVEAVIDKDLTAALLARLTGADGLIILTDVDGVFENWGADKQKLIRDTHPSALTSENYASGSMRPKVEAACDFVARGGQFSAIGNLNNAKDVVDGRSGTRIRASFP